MSRSYKKTPHCGLKKDKFYKKYSNHKVRRIPVDAQSPKNKTYKKVICSWNICDYEEVGLSFEEYWEEILNNWRIRNNNSPIPNKEDVYKYYLKHFIRK